MLVMAYTTSCTLLCSIYALLAYLMLAAPCYASTGVVSQQHVHAISNEPLWVHFAPECGYSFSPCKDDRACTCRSFSSAGDKFTMSHYAMAACCFAAIFYTWHVYPSAAYLYLCM